MGKCPDTTDQDDYSITLDREEMTPDDCSTRDNCNITKPMSA